MFLCLCKNCFIGLIVLTTYIFFVFCVLLLLLIFYDLNFTLRTTSCDLWNVFWILIILNCVLNGKIMYQLPIFLLYFLLMKIIFDHVPNKNFRLNNVYSASPTSSSFLNSLVVSKKYPKRFLSLNSSRCSFLV